MIQLRVSGPREFVEEISDFMQDQNGWEQVGMVGFDARTWRGVTGDISDILRYLAAAQGRGATVAVITATVTNQSLDVVAFVESVPEREEEIVPSSDPGEVLPELPRGGTEPAEPG